MTGNGPVNALENDFGYAGIGWSGEDSLADYIEEASDLTGAVASGEIGRHYDESGTNPMEALQSRNGRIG